MKLFIICVCCIFMTFDLIAVKIELNKISKNQEEIKDLLVKKTIEVRGE
jgi:hypothetical protein